MKRYHGLTIVELMVTLAVAIVMLAVGVPMFQSMQERSRATAQANRLVTAIQLARNEALSRGVPISVCAIADPAADPLTCGNANTDWTNGWQVFEDSGNTPNQIDGADPDPAQIRVFEELDPATTGLTLTASAPALRFLPTGELDPAENNNEWVRFAYPHAPNTDRCVSIGFTGTARTTKQKSGDACP